MFTLRGRYSNNIEKRQQRPFVEITANGMNIPLKEENWLERWCTLPMTADWYKQLYEFHVKENDVYVVTFPKCGTTWIQEATWLLVNNLDFQTANQQDISARNVFMDLSAIYNALPRNTIQLANQAVSPRVLISHLPAHLIPKQIWQKNCKIIYYARNPKDMAVSYFHFHAGLGTWQGNISEFIMDLINNDIMYSPYWEHIMDFWRMRHEKNIFFTTYEDMKRNLSEVLIKLNKFLEKPELSDKQLQELEKHLSFESMKANQHVNPTTHIKSDHSNGKLQANFQFMRRGIVGSYKDELSEADQQKLDDWIAKHLEKFNIKLKDIFGEAFA